MCSEYIWFIIVLCCAIVILIWTIIFQYSQLEKLEKSKSLYEDLWNKELTRNEELKKILQWVKDLMPF